MSTHDWYDDEPVTVADAIVLAAHHRRVCLAAELWARVRRDPAATRVALRQAEDALLRAVEGER